jgi:hypothetical protein
MTGPTAARKASRTICHRFRLAALSRKYPPSLTVVSELAYCSYQANDPSGAKPLFGCIGANVAKQIWHDDKPRFLRARTWAFSE